MVALAGKMRGAAAPAALLLAAGIASLTLGAYWQFVLSIAVVYVLMALSLVVLTGWSGQLNLHVAALGLGWGAYSAFALVTAGVPAAWAIVAAGVLCAPFAAGVAYIAVRFRGLELAVATLAMGLIFERLFFRNIAKALTDTGDGGTPFQSSFVSMPRPEIGGLTFTGDASFFWFSLAVAVLLFVLVTNLDRASTGRTLRAISDREVMAETVGVPIIGYRIGAFVLSILIAGTAGALFGSLKLGIAPDSFNLDLSFQILAATVIGGIRSPRGAVIGGGIAALLPQIVRFGPLTIFGGERLFVLFGVGMILVLWRRPEGLESLLRGRKRSRAPEDTLSDDMSLVAVTGPAHGSGALAHAAVERRVYGSRLDRYAQRAVLQTTGLRIRFGGVVALDGVDLFVPEGEICVLIGPNGAGKSTLFNCVNGLLVPDEGRIFLEGRDVTDLPAHRRAALGVGRTFQTVEAFRGMTVTENLLVAGHRIRSAGALSEAFGLPAARRSERALRERADEIISLLGIGAIAGRRPAELPLGMLRVLEVGMALVARPRLLLLDEPSAGLDPDETAALGELVQRVRSAYGLGVLLVEHDMELVANLAEHVYVLDFGTIISQGTPDEVRNDPIVLEKYLGEDLVGMTEPVKQAAGAERPRRPRKAAASGGRSRARR